MDRYVVIALNYFLIVLVILLCSILLLSSFVYLMTFYSVMFGFLPLYFFVYFS